MEKNEERLRKKQETRKIAKQSGTILGSGARSKESKKRGARSKERGEQGARSEEQGE
jgi:hypothetical protein